MFLLNVHRLVLTRGLTSGKATYLVILNDIKSVYGKVMTSSTMPYHSRPMEHQNLNKSPTNTQYIPQVGGGVCN